MKKIVLELHAIDYALIHWEENTLTPWVAAWAPKTDPSLHWGQGHYFRTKRRAVEYLVETYKERRRR